MGLPVMEGVELVEGFGVDNERCTTTPHLLSLLVGGYY